MSKLPGIEAFAVLPWLLTRRRRAAVLADPARCGTVRGVRFPQQAPVTAAKKLALWQRIQRLGIELNQVEASYVRASGPGGQKVNKTSSAVVLRYEPLGLTVKWSTERSRALNQFLALRELVDEIEVRVSPETSERLAEQRKLRRIKGRRERKRRKQTPPAAP